MMEGYKFQANFRNHNDQTHAGSPQQQQEEEASDSSAASAKVSTPRGKKTTQSKRARHFKKAPQAPKRFKSSYMFFSIEKQKELSNVLLDHPPSQRKATNVAKKVAKAWKRMSKEERQAWEAMSEQDKARFEAEKAEYDGPWSVPATQKEPKKKDPTAPKRPMSAFLAFSNCRRATMKRQNPEMTNGDMSKELARIWKSASEEVKRPYIEEEARLRKEYNVVIAAWRKDKADKEKSEGELLESLELQRLEKRHENSKTSSRQGQLLTPSDFERARAIFEEEEEEEETMLSSGVFPGAAITSTGGLSDTQMGHCSSSGTNMAHNIMGLTPWESIQLAAANPFGFQHAAMTSLNGEERNSSWQGPANTPPASQGQVIYSNFGPHGMQGSRHSINANLDFPLLEALQNLNRLMGGESLSPSMSQTSEMGNSGMAFGGNNADGIPIPSNAGCTSSMDARWTSGSPAASASLPRHHRADLPAGLGYSSDFSTNGNMDFPMATASSCHADDIDISLPSLGEDDMVLYDEHDGNFQGNSYLTQDAPSSFCQSQQQHPCFFPCGGDHLF